MLQVLLSVLNQECCAPLSEDPLNEVKGESTQSVSVGHHNLAYAASLCFTQKGTQPFPFKVDTGSDVGDDSVPWKLCTHMFHLSLEVIALFGGGNSAVDDVVTIGARLLVVVFGFFEEGCEVVLPMATRGSDRVDFALRFPGAKGGQANSELLGNF